MEQLFSRLFILFLRMAIFVIIEVLVVEKVLFDLYLPPDYHHITGVLNSFNIDNNIKKEDKQDNKYDNKPSSESISVKLASIDQIEKYEAIHPLEEILKEANVELTSEERAKLPSVDDVYKLYGTK